MRMRADRANTNIETKMPQYVPLVRSVLCVAGLRLFAGSTPVYGQAGATRHGGWFTFDLAYGSAHLSCDTCRQRPHVDGFNVILGLGGTRSPQLRLGAVLDVWEHWFPDGETLRAITTARASLYYYPRIQSGFFLDTGAGVSNYRVLKGLREGFLFENADVTYYSGTGLGFTVGLGYDARVSRSLSIRSRVAYAHADVGTLHSPPGAAVASGWTQNVLSLGVGMLLGFSPD